jgi:hypothetical protein
VLPLLFAGPAAPPAGGPTYLLRDTFTDTDGTSLAAHTMDVGSGWTIQAGSWAVASNKAHNPDLGGGWDTVTADAGQGDAAVSADLATGDYAGLVGRLQDASNFWMGVLSDVWNELRIYECSGGAFILRASTAYTPSGTQTLQFTFSGTGITLAVGATSVSHTSSSLQSQTKFGLVTFQSDIQFDNFQAV